MKLTISTVEILKALGLPKGIEIEISDRNGKDWISNTGRDSPHYPEILGAMTEIEVKRRSGEIHTGRANDYGAAWRETDGCLADIVAYRILKD